MVSSAIRGPIPAGGGASEATEGPRYRTWGELYGISIDDRSAGRLCRRQAQDHGRRRRHRRPHRAGGQSRLLGRPEPHDDRRAAGAAIGDARSDAARLQCLRRQGAMDLGARARARLRQRVLEPRHRGRLRLRQRALWRAGRRRADRARLLLDPGAEPHRAQGRARICARHDGRIPGGRRLRSAHR